MFSSFEYTLNLQNQSIEQLIDFLRAVSTFQNNLAENDVWVTDCDGMHDNKKLTPFMKIHSLEQKSFSEWAMTCPGGKFLECG
jgi:hypothetical protein